MYTLIDHHNLHVPHEDHNGPTVNYSVLTRVACAVPLRGFAIKYVVDGVERYAVNNTPFPVGAGGYLLANRHGSGRLDIESQRAVKGICIELTAPLMDEVVAAHATPEAFDVPAGSCFFTGPEFLENTYRSEHTRLGGLLQRLAAEIVHAPQHAHGWQRSLYYSLAEALIADHLATVPLLRRVHAVRSGTRKDIYRRVERARAFIDDGAHMAISVAAMAREAGMSEYHFFRAFRAVHDVTPHQYLLAKRLALAHAMLRDGVAAVSDVALLAGFSGIFSFSKAFKKRYGIPPSQVRGQKSRIG